MSFLNNLSLYFLSKKESPKVVKHFFNWTQLQNIMLVAYDNQLSDVVDFLNACKKQSIKTTVAIIYSGKPELAPKPHFEHMIIHKKNFNFFQLPNQETLNTLNSIKPEVLINLASAQQTQALALSKLIVAPCKISQFQHDIFDITINKTTTITEYLKQVIIYLNMIKPN